MLWPSGPDTEGGLLQLWTLFAAIPVDLRIGQGHIRNQVVHSHRPDDDSAALATKLLRHLLSTVQRCRAWWGGHECGIVHQLL
jgi:hypothetical protein